MRNTPTYSALFTRNESTRNTMHNLARQHQDVGRSIVGGSSDGNGGPFTAEEDCPRCSQISYRWGGLKDKTERFCRTLQMVVVGKVILNNRCFQQFCRKKNKLEYNITECVLQCSRTCEDGVQMRRVACQDGLGAGSTECDPGDKPADNQTCNLGPCPRWNYGDWAAVSRQCLLAAVGLLIGFVSN